MFPTSSPVWATYSLYFLICIPCTNIISKTASLNKTYLWVSNVLAKDKGNTKNQVPMDIFRYDNIGFIRPNWDVLPGSANDRAIFHYAAIN